MDKDISIMTGDDRERLIATASHMLQEENDDEALQAITGLIKSFVKDERVRQGVIDLYKKGYAFLQTSEDSGHHQGWKRESANPSSSSQDTRAQVLVRLPPKSKLKSRLDHEHPLQNDLILQNIFQFCSVNTLKNCRLVSRNWRDVSLDAWRSKAVLVTETVDPESWSLVMNSFGGIPFNRFKAHCSGPDGEFGLFKQIADEFPASVRYLNLSGDKYLPAMRLSFFNLTELRNLKFRLSYDDFVHELQVKVIEDGKLPELSTTHQHLKTIELQMYPDIYFNYSLVDNIWLGLFEHVPNLDCLRLTFVSDRDDQSREEMKDCKQLEVESKILMALRTARVKGNYSTLNLKELVVQLPFWDAYNYLNDSIIAAIAESKFPLERFSMDFGVDAFPGTLRLLMKSCTDTLEYFEGIMTPNKGLRFSIRRYSKCMSELLKLKEVVLKNGLVWGLRFLGMFEVPKLQKLTLEKTVRSRWEENIIKFIDRGVANFKVLLEDICLPSVEVFKYDGDRVFTGDDLRSLAEALPNLKELDIVITADTFSVVCECWKTLRIFRATSSDEHPAVDDESITGIPVVVHEDVNPETPVRKPNITDLRNLTDFILRTSERDIYRKVVGTTDHSVVHGILLLPRLHTLHMTFRKLSPDVRAALEDHVLNLLIRET